VEAIEAFKIAKAKVNSPGGRTFGWGDVKAMERAIDLLDSVV